MHRELENCGKIVEIKKREREVQRSININRSCLEFITYICTAREERQYSQTKRLLRCSPDFRAFVVALFQPYTPGSNVPLQCG